MSKAGDSSGEKPVIKQTSSEEKIREAMYLTYCAYGIDPDNPPGLDRTFFETRKL